MAPEVKRVYQALYRKYRPKTFDDVVGQPQVTETLKRQVETGRLSHAYLFIGTRGTGKTTCAKILAKAVNCEHPDHGNPCGRCKACLGIEDGSVLDVVELDAASNNGVDNVRALRDEAVFTPASVRKRVYIVDEVHMLSMAAFNALLKILEEPPEHLMFILATTELQKVPATILSRCQRHSFRRLSPETVAARLLYVAEREGIPLTADGAALLGRLADGAMRDGLSLLDQCAGREGAIDTAAVLQAMGLGGNLRTLELLDAVRNGDTPGALEQFAALWRDGKDPATLLQELSTLLRDVLMTRVAPKSGAGLCTGGYAPDTLARLAKELPEETLLWQLRTIQDALGAMRSAPTPRTGAELCLVRLCEPRLAGGLPALESRVARLEQGGLPQAAPPRPDHQTASAERAAPSAAPAPEPKPASAPEPETDRPPWDETPPPPGDEDLPPWEEPAGEPAASAPPAGDAPEIEAPPAAPAAPSGQGKWQEFLDLAQRELDPSLYVLLRDDYHCRGYLEGGELRLYPQNAFARGILEKASQTIAALAQRAAGGPVRVQFLEGAGPEQPASSLDALMKFGNVTFE